MDNIILLSADRNGSTALQHELLTKGLNQDNILWLGECFSQDTGKVSPIWYDPINYVPAQVIDVINKGTGKSVFLKIQITWNNFDLSYLNISASRKIFLHRNLFDSTLSRCVALLTGHWFTNPKKIVEIPIIEVPEDFFLERLNYRIDKYMTYLDKITNWTTEYYRYEQYNFEPDLPTIPNTDKKTTVKNYEKLKEIYLEKKEIDIIESKIDDRFIKKNFSD